MKYTQYIHLSQEIIDKYNKLLDLPSEEDGVINAGYDEDGTIEIFTAHFEDGHDADIKICSGQLNFFCDPVLFKRNKLGLWLEVDVLDCADNLDSEYEFTDEGNTYLVIIDNKEGDDND